MPINRDLNIAPYNDDFNISKKYYRVLFKPGYALQARELTQLQTILQNQIEQFGDNIYKEGSIIKGCTFTELNRLTYVKVVDDITPTLYVDRIELSEDNSVIEYYYELESPISGLKAYIVSASNGFQSKAPNLNTFYINYLNTVENTQQKVFAAGETLNIKEYRIIKSITTDPDTLEETITEIVEGGNTVKTTSVAAFSNPTGFSFGLNVSEGIIFQKGHFLYADEQTIILVKYLPEPSESLVFAQPHDISVGFMVNEEIVSSQRDTTLLDNANGSENENAPGADRLKLSPILISRSTQDAIADTSFFTLRKYENGSATQIRDVSQFNSIATELARRTYEESGDYIVDQFSIDTERKDDKIYVKVGPGTVYAKGYRVRNNAQIYLPIDDIEGSKIQPNQPLSVSYGGYVRVLDADDATGIVDIRTYQTVNLLNVSDQVIGTAVVKDYTSEVSIIDTDPLNAADNGRLYLFAIRMMNDSTPFSDVRFVKLGTGSTGKIKIDPVLREASESKLLFNLGQRFVKGITNLNLYMRKKETISIPNGSTQATITPAPGETFTSVSRSRILVVGMNNRRLKISTPTITVPGNLTFSVPDQTGGTITVYYTVAISPTLAKAKQSFDVFVKTTYQNLKTKYTLGLPDGYKLLEVEEVSTGKIFTNSFKLVPNQKDDYYDHSYLELISGRPTPNNGSILSVKFSVYRPDSAGPYHFFTVNSYSNINPSNIPYFYGKSGVYNLRDCIDFRPHRMPMSGITYSTNKAGASLVLTGEQVGLGSYTADLFSSSVSHVVPALEAPSTLSIEHYLNRTDSIAVNSYGDFFLVKGDESTYSKPKVAKEKTTIANIYIPGYPSYTSNEAKLNGNNEYGIKVEKRGVENVTMEEIADMKNQIEQLTYYVTLSQLEADTKNLLIKDASGNNRFKNGIVVDPFNDLKIADTKSPEFNAALDFAERSLSPSVQKIPMDLVVTGLNGAQVYNGSIATLASDSNSVEVISQPFATSFRTATSNFYNYAGQGFVTPEYDGAYDITSEPAVLNLDLTDAFDSLVQGIQEFIPLQSTETTVTGTSRNVQANNQRIVTEVSTNLKDTVSRIQSSAATNQSKVGDFVTNFSFKPYMRSRRVKIYMGGLRPNTRHHFFFDGINVDAHVSPAISKGDISNNETAFMNIVETGAKGAAVTTNSNGVLYAVFTIPPETFFVGDRKLNIADVNVFDSIDSAAVSKGFLTYRAYNFSIDKKELTLSTRTPEFSIETVSTNRTVTSRTVVNVPRVNSESSRDRRQGQVNDPLAQTFFIKQGHAVDSNCLYASKIDLFFKRKSNTNGITIMLREVDNGYPSYEILPFSKVHLTKNEVNVSEDGSAATTVNFKAPVRLDTEKEYCVVIMPDAADPDYLVFTSKVGGTDLITNNAVTQDWGDGVLFTSTNDRAWSSYQDEDIKFKLYRYNFNSSSGSVTLGIEGSEAFSFSDYSGRFIDNELVYAIKNANISANFTSGSITITGTNIGSTYQVGDYIAPINSLGTVLDLLKVVSVSANNSSITVDEASKISGVYQTRAVVAGNVAYFNRLKPSELFLEKSSAREARKFVTGDTVIGLNSGATGLISSVNNYEISFIQPSIERITDKTSNISISARVVDPANPLDLPYTKGMTFGDKTVFNERGCVVYSKSNDTTGSKGLKIVLDLTNDSVSTSTPVIDTENALIFLNRYNIDNNERPVSSYVSKIVSLAEGFDAEDFRLYVTAYKPEGTEVNAFVRLGNASDPMNVEDNPWIPLDLFGENIYSSTTNLDDFREYIYEITDVNTSNYGKENGVVFYKNSTGKYSKYKNFQLKLTMKSANIGSVPRLLDYRGIAME